MAMLCNIKVTCYVTNIIPMLHKGYVTKTLMLFFQMLFARHKFLFNYVTYLLYKC